MYVLKHFQNWLDAYFPRNSYDIRVTIPHNELFTQNDYDKLKEYFNIDDSRLKINTYQWKRKTGFNKKLRSETPRTSVRSLFSISHALMPLA